MNNRINMYLQKSARFKTTPMTMEEKQGWPGKLSLGLGTAGTLGAVAYYHHQGKKAEQAQEAARLARRVRGKNTLGFGLAGAAGLAGIAYRMKGDREIAAHAQKGYQKWEEAIKADHAIADAESAARSKDYKDSVIDYIDSKRGK